MSADQATTAPARQAGAWLADWSISHLEKLATVMRLIAAGGRSNDACLHARQFLDHALGAGRVVTGADYREAAAVLDGQGSTAAGAAMEALASADGELRAAAPAWQHRYAARPQTQPERAAADRIRNGEVKESGHAAAGIDGAHYTRAWYPRSGKPAIVITTSAMTEEIINFANTADAAAWLAARTPGTAGPLPTTVTGPASRTAREEELLAFLLREPASTARLAATIAPATFTTHLRAELFTAIRWTAAAGGAPGYSVIAAAYGRRLLRAPAEAAPDIGWPDATRAMTYLNRLMTTPVTPAQASAAATLLASIDAAVQSRQQPAAPSPAAARRTPARTPAPGERQLLQPPPSPVPGRGSPAPRL